MPELHVYVYSLSLLAACGYAIWRGGPVEKAGGWTALLGSVVSVVVILLTPRSWHAVMPALWLIDGLVCASYLVLMIASARGWAIVCFACSAAGLASHAARALQLRLAPIAYYLTEAKWSYGVLVFLALGTWEHVRATRRSMPSPGSSATISDMPPGN